MKNESAGGNDYQAGASGQQRLTRVATPAEQTEKRRDRQGRGRDTSRSNGVTQLPTKEGDRRKSNFDLQ